MGYKRNLKGLRVSKGFTQKEIAKLIHMSKVTYVKKENEKSSFTVYEALDLAKILGVSVESIFLGNK
ncbi:MULTISPECIES: helix-turn-helix transcriptional regulator [Romboutsia]|uniref:Cro/C1-type HTH domain profile n=1 Tax=Romboutsia hominis TaxID=1507512 RepID=A0A2P2BQA5_9FIRM|nr:MULTISPECIES: helix-turn-helix domain-containing protein [Romboutsia]MCH1959846.1 helix-turn-helix domain-containing protein [Romboutsia hominis]MCH1969731.1 helix-turn-helix domain-containing protein [Romboutsia hominis]MDB8791568.1 helix-turn-helix domain-containing protein [Romboutsia sp. 1001216sp1]MDB8792595.1 helix-turn-helix domain-containing protein [Romboutsia sp. 1001216sp1]MDB8796238.1 helix-turn-helix domain-containing protein [Romboutsia sp. 1001216sp1]